MTAIAEPLATIVGWFNKLMGAGRGRSAVQSHMKRCAKKAAIDVEESLKERLKNHAARSPRKDQGIVAGYPQTAGMGDARDRRDYAQQCGGILRGSGGPRERARTANANTSEMLVIPGPRGSGRPKSGVEAVPVTIWERREHIRWTK